MKHLEKIILGILTISTAVFTFSAILHDNVFWAIAGWVMMILQTILLSASNSR